MANHSDEEKGSGGTNIKVKEDSRMIMFKEVKRLQALGMIVDSEIRGAKRSNEDYTSLMNMLNQLLWFRETFNAASSFYAVMKGTDADQLIKWVDRYRNSSIRQIKTFAVGISLDLMAVKKAITTNVSNGITEGFVNKLKEVKRTMYGRAKLELLKRKMMLEYSWFN